MITFSELCLDPRFVQLQGPAVEVRGGERVSGGADPSHQLDWSSGSQVADGDRGGVTILRGNLPLYCSRFEICISNANRTVNSEIYHLVFKMTM